ncbi:iron-sulfur cluster carrier protein ApbC [Aliiglaciecola litoralis]|uniref:Iron-sulfur cluster carrier protein n=1 Tax=Aliiglaciecola litoralis TaxID=582857 RepID=A0ABN1LMS3_9ALTE
MPIALSEAHNTDEVYQHAASSLGITPKQFAQCCHVEGNILKITLPFACETQHGALVESLETLGLDRSQIELRVLIDAKQTKLPRLKRVKNIIAVASGKGGVGKSATSVNLAFALQAQGAKVGLLDADIYGPSVPIMLGNPQAQPQSEDNRHMIPLDCHGVVANSIGYLVPPENATIWRGPMASKALQQIVNETLWPELDYLIIDMPPGTGDIQLTLAQMVPLTAAVIVTTPQDIALADATKGIAMFNKVDIPVLGLIENMSYYLCRKCGHKDHVFASGGGEKLAQQHHMNLLGQLPLDIMIREHADGGEPLIISQPQSELSNLYLQIAMQVSKSLAFSINLATDNSIEITTV